MPADRGDASWRRLKVLFAQASELDGIDRRRFLDTLGGYRTQVESLLDAHDTTADFLTPPAEAEFAGRRVGAYRLERLIAAGGMGEVYRARRADQTFEKRVAVKIIRHHLVTPRLRRRFERERQTLARLEHPNICRLLDGGTTADGLPFLVMEHIDGRPIDRYCSEQSHPIRARLHLFLTVCDAVQQAHRSLIVHSDLKPANVLVDGDGVAKLVDFGISRMLTDDATPAGATATRTFGLTQAYASPEQIRGEPVTTATDIYSLGVMLHELLCGRRPFEVADMATYEAERIICERPASLPSTHAASRRERRMLAGDLDTIVGKALQKNADRRYGSVEQMAEDVRRFLDGRPVLARRDGLGYRLGKYVRRNAVQVSAAAIVLLAVTGAMIGITSALVRARAAQHTSQRVLGFYEDVLASTTPILRGGDEVTVFELLEEAHNRIQTDLANEPEVEAGVRLAIGRTYVNMMLWREALPHLQHALAHYRRTRPADDPVIADCLSPLGRVLTHLQQSNAIAVQREGLEIRRRVYGAEHPLVAESIGNLAFASWCSGAPPRWTDAERGYLEAIALFDTLGLGASSDRARYTMSLGFMYQRQGRLRDAEERYRESLALYDCLPVPRDVYRYVTMGCYAGLLESSGRYAEAIEVLQGYERIAPDDYQPLRRRSVAWRLARCHMACGDRERAREALLEAHALDAEMALSRRPSSSPSARSGGG